MVHAAGGRPYVAIAQQGEPNAQNAPKLVQLAVVPAVTGKLTLFKSPHAEVIHGAIAYMVTITSHGLAVASTVSAPVCAYPLLPNRVNKRSVSMFFFHYIYGLSLCVR